MRDIDFKCPVCEGTCLVVIQNVVESVEVLFLDNLPDEGPCLLPGDVIDSEVVDTSHWECAKCGYELGTSEEVVIKWLENSGMIASASDDN